MARGKKTGGRDWQKGQSGNPAGGPPLPEDYRAARKLGRVMLQKILDKYSDKTLAELEDLADSEDLPVIELGVVRIMRDATKNADMSRWEWLLGRSSIGKVKESVEISLPKPTKVERFDKSKPGLELGAEIEEEE